MLLSQAKVLDQNAAEAKRTRKVNQAQQRKKKANDKETTAAAATATDTIKITKDELLKVLFNYANIQKLIVETCFSTNSADRIVHNT
jgi:hypothetical protein